MTTNHFAVALSSYLETNSIRAKQLETLAGLPNATIAKLTAGQRPSVERLAEILQAIPSTESAKLLDAYLRDAVPQQWRDAVQIIITVAETALQSAPPEVKDTLTRTLERIAERARSDIDFAAWLLDTAALMQLTPEPATPALYTLPDAEPSAKVAEE